MAEENEKPSFLGSVMSGIGGWVKGGLAVGAIAAAAGGLLGAIGGPETAVIAAAGMGALGAGLGATLGGFTGVLQSREDKDTGPSKEEIAMAAFAQGVQVGAAMEHEVETQEKQQPQKNFVQQLEQSRGGRKTVDSHALAQLQREAFSTPTGKGFG